MLIFQVTLDSIGMEAVAQNFSPFPLVIAL
jgi:hypothetical protein